MATIVNRDLSRKQWEIIDAIMRGNPDGTWLDFDQLLDRMSYGPSKPSMHFSLRALINRGLVENAPQELRRKQNRRVLAPTTLAYERCRR